MLGNTLFYAEVDELLSVVDRLGDLMADAGVPYELVGGMAVFLHVRAVSEENARLTNDVDVAIRRSDLELIKRLAPHHGVEFRHATQRKAKGAIHFVFAGEKVRPDYLEPVPELADVPPAPGIRLASIANLLRMKLTSNRLRDMTHVRDLIDVGLITPEMEVALSVPLRQRLDFIKGHE